MMDRLVVFLDKDGTLVEDVPYNVDPAKMTLESGAAEGLRMLAEADFRLVVVSNQSGVARGYFPEEALGVVAARLNEILRQEAGASLDGFYYCPHHPDGSVTEYAIECDCRKPHPGMLLKAASDMNFRLSDAWMVGDILNDVEAGNRAGCRTILIDNGHETQWLPGEFRIPDFTAADLREATITILRETTRQQPAPQPLRSKGNQGGP